ncbi:unnamed protein product [Rhizophagus irregularis]|nr:unnamed protein product [Rhizophagus irregularis]
MIKISNKIIMNKRMTILAESLVAYRDYYPSVPYVHGFMDLNLSRRLRNDFTFEVQNVSKIMHTLTTYPTDDAHEQAIVFAKVLD